jgi:hypothetical protein
MEHAIGRAIARFRMDASWVHENGGIAAMNRGC